MTRILIILAIMLAIAAAFLATSDWSGMPWAKEPYVQPDIKTDSVR